MKQRKLGKRAGALLLAAAVTVTAFPRFSAEVYAAERPDTTQFATVDELKKFNTNDDDGAINPAKIYFGKDHQQWWIAGSRNDNLVLFAASPLAAEQQFESGRDDVKIYSEDWKCDYAGNVPSEVHPNHYGASSLRTILQGLETTCFTDAEQGFMNSTTVFTRDNKNGSVYSTTDKLYLAYGDYSEDQFITVGANSSEDLTNGLRVDQSYWGEQEIMWLRAPYLSSGSIALTAEPGSSVSADPVDEKRAVVPAFELKLSSIAFSSAAPAAAADGKLSPDSVFTLRYRGDIGGVSVSRSKQSAVVTGLTNDHTYLVVQNREGAWAKKISKDGLVAAGEIDSKLASFENCKVWLETGVDGILYASEATQSLGYNVRVNAGKDMTVITENGVQLNVTDAIADIMIQANEGYGLPDNYKDQVVLSGGLSVRQTGKKVIISGVPTGDVWIDLPDATLMRKAEKPVLEVEKTSTSVTARVKNQDSKFGAIEYQWDDGDWKEDNATLSGLSPHTEHTVSVRFKGQGIYLMSDETKMKAVTLKDGNDAVSVPANLTIDDKENLKLSDVSLSKFSRWSWVNGNEGLSAGTKTHKARLDTTALEGEYDFTKVTGYDAKGHYVERDVKVEVKPVNEKPTITANDRTLTVGDKFDPLNGVTAKDKEDGDLTKSIKVTKNTVDPSKAGTYEVVYQVTDKSGASATKTIKVTVKAKETKTGDQKTSTDNKDTGKGNSVATGDETSMGLYLSLLAVSGLFVIIFSILKRKSYKQK